MLGTNSAKETYTGDIPILSSPFVILNEALVVFKFGEDCLVVFNFVVFLVDSYAVYYDEEVFVFADSVVIEITFFDVVDVGNATSICNDTKGTQNAIKAII